MPNSESLETADNQSEPIAEIADSGNEGSVFALGDLPKSFQIAAIDRVWAINDEFRLSAVAILDAIPIGEAIRLQMAFLEKEAAVEAKATQDAAAGRVQKPYEVIGRTAIVNVKGVLTKKQTSASFLFGGTSTIALRNQFRAIKADKDIVNWLAVFESPGGQCAGLSECADDLRALNAAKPGTAFINDQCDSAAYFLASQCSQIFMNRMGRCGYIGTMAAIEDTSAKAAMAGVKVLLFKSDGATYKGAGTPGTQITPEQMAVFQELVDHYGDDFKAAVQTGRALSDDQLKAVAIGREFTATQAIAMGLIDGVCSYEDCLASVSAGLSAVSTSTGIPVPTQARASTVSANGEPMTFIDKMVAYIRGQSPEALADAGIDPDALEQEMKAVSPAPNPQDTALIARLEALEGQRDRERMNLVQERAAAFAEMLIEPGNNGKSLAYHNQRDSIVQTFVTLACMNGGKPQFDSEGSLVVTDALKTYCAGMLNAIPNSMQEELIRGKKPNSPRAVSPDNLRSVLAGTTKDPAKYKERLERLGIGGEQ